MLQYKGLYERSAFMLKKTNLELISSLFYILVGVLLIVLRDRALAWTMTLVGAIFLVFGILKLIGSNWTNGAFGLIVGLSIIVFGWVLTQIVILVFGILIAVKGIVALIEELRKYPQNIVDIALAALTIVIGLLLAFGELLSAMIAVAGVMLMFNGIIKLINVSVENNNESR